MKSKKTTATKKPTAEKTMTKQQARAFCDRCPDFARGCALTCKHFPNA